MLLKLQETKKKIIGKVRSACILQDDIEQSPDIFTHLRHLFVLVLCLFRNSLTLYSFFVVFLFSSKGCHQLHTLSDGPVTFTSPRYPLNYRGNRKCEFRFVASPGKKINLFFDEFILQEDQRCRLDFVRVRKNVNIHNLTGTLPPPQPSPSRKSPT